jgi:hypothetical protein
MQLVADKKIRDQVAAAAQQALDHHQPRAYRISVDRDAILEDEGWYHIVVTTENDQRDRDFYDALAEAEAELQDQNGHQYLLVPTVGE